MAEESNRQSRLHPEMIVGVSAVFIGVCALMVSLYETRLMRQEQRAAVLPILELGRSHYVTDEDADMERWRLSIHASNVGIGPARILDFRVTVDDEPQLTWGAAMQALLGVHNDVRYGQSSINGRTLPADREVVIFNLSDERLAPAIVAEFDRLDFEACFCSVFDECWTASFSGFGGVEPVEQCVRDESSFLE